MEIGFLAAFIVTNLLEILVAYWLLKKTEKFSLISAVVICSNIVTMPFVWFVFPFFLNLQYFETLLISELFAFGVEILIYLDAFRNSSRSNAIAAAISGNLASFVFGLIVVLL